MIALKTLVRGFAAAVIALTVTCGAQAQSTGDRLTKLEQQMQAFQTGPKPADIEGRLLAMERAIELLTGQVEEARFRAERTAEQLRVLTEDMNLRIATLEQSIGAQPGAVTPAAGAAVPAAPAPRAAAASQTPASQRFSFDAPASAPMNAPRPAPQAAAIQAVPLNGPPVATGTGAVDANGGFVVRTDAGGKPLAADPNAAAAAQQANAAPPPPPPAPRAAPAAPGVTGQQLAALPVDVKLPGGSAKEQYDFAFDFLKRNDYARGESALRQFLEKNPKDELAGNAQYWLAQTFFARGSYQDAAREFMKGYQSYPKNAKAPDNLLQLGMSLEKLSQNDGACTAFGLINKEYPKAPDQIKNATKTERSKLKCK